MKTAKSLQENLRNLPKFTLNTVQKNNIILALESEQTSRKRTQLFLPLLSVLVICSTAFLLFISNENGSVSWLNELKQSIQIQVPLTAEEGKIFLNLPYEVIGVEGKIGILQVTEQFVAEDTRRVGKLMLYFWGNSSELVGKNYRVEARNTYNHVITLSEGILYSPIANEDAHTLTKFNPFPSEGEWQLSFFIDEQLFEEFTLEILPPFPKTEHYTLRDSPLELTIGEETEINIESSKQSDDGIDVKLLNDRGVIVSEDVFVQDGEFIDASTMQPFYVYRGQIKFPKQGAWQLVIDGEKTKRFKN